MIWEVELRRCSCVKGGAMEGERERSGPRIYVDGEGREGASLQIKKRELRGAGMGR